MHIEVSSDGTVSLVKSVERKKREKGNSIICNINDYISIDIESTGFDPMFDEIIEIGAIHYINQVEVGRFHSLIKPQNSIPNFIIELTGITNDMVKDSPSIESVLPQFISFIGDSTLLGHNINFDINFLYDESVNFNGYKIQNNFIDTLRLSRFLFKELDNHKLATLVKEFNISEKTEHRSISDCVMTAKCYEYMKKYSKDNSIDINFILKTHRERQKLRASDILFNAELHNCEHFLYNKVCVFTGTLEKMLRKDAMQIVADLGGINGDNITSKTNYLILGNNDYCPLIKGGKSNKQKKAEQLILKGHDLKILSENVFYDMIEIE
jgi:DNA polymerase-3 subunit epsilon